MLRHKRSTGNDAGPAHEKLAKSGLRPTRQRRVLAQLLFSGPDRHVTAEELHQEALAAGATISLATVYNTLNQFTAANLLREVAIEGAKTYFDTNTPIISTSISSAREPSWTSKIPMSRSRDCRRRRRAKGSPGWM